MATYLIAKMRATKNCAYYGNCICEIYVSGADSESVGRGWLAICGRRPRRGPAGLAAAAARGAGKSA